MITETGWTEREDTVERQQRQDKKGKKLLPQLADLGNPAILHQPESRSRWAMSHISHPLPPYPSFCLPFPLLSFSRWVGHYLFISFLPYSFVLTTFCFDFPSPLFPSNCSFSFSLSPWMSGSVWLLLKPDYSPQWAHCTSPGLTPATGPASGVPANVQTAPATLLDLIRMHAVDWKEE